MTWPQSLRVLSASLELSLEELELVALSLEVLSQESGQWPQETYSRQSSQTSGAEIQRLSKTLDAFLNTLSSICKTTKSSAHYHLVMSTPFSPTSDDAPLRNQSNSSMSRQGRKLSVLDDV